VIRRLTLTAAVAAGAVAAVRSGRVRPIFAWYDMWVGMYVDREHRRLYLLPVPCAGVVIQLPGRPRAIDEHVDPRDDLIHSLWLYIGPHTERQLTTDQRELLYDIADPDGVRWWRCASCEHPGRDHNVIAGDCTLCPCAQFERTAYER
jgi:hypothetical protein